MTQAVVGMFPNKQETRTSTLKGCLGAACGLLLFFLILQDAVIMESKWRLTALMNSWEPRSGSLPAGDPQLPARLSSPWSQGRMNPALNWVPHCKDVPEAAACLRQLRTNIYSNPGKDSCCCTSKTFTTFSHPNPSQTLMNLNC